MGIARQRFPGRSLKDLKREINARHGEPVPSKNGPKHRPVEVVDENGIPYTTSQVLSAEPWTPSPYTAFKVLLSARLGAAVWSGISDCDETFNYWEPTHHLLYGHGLQTWEYDPKFALRSYLYILVHTIPAWVYSRLLQPNPMLVFYFLRCMFGFICALCEVYFYRGVLCEFGANVGRLCLALLVFSCGMFISSTAFLPSTTSMYLTLLSMGAWFHQKYKLAIFTTALSTFLSWPFAALLGLPIAIDIVLMKKQWKLFITWSIISAVTILGPQLLCDSYYYNKPVFASLNIVWYNVFTEHGPDLYGTEPASFYLKNGLLNFNYIFVAALLVLPMQTFARLVLQGEGGPGTGIFLPDYVSQAPMYLWLLVFWTRPHKEERFLFPIYPLVCLAGAMFIDSCQKLVYFLFVKVKSRHFLAHTGWLGLVAVIISGILSLSRIAALYQGYHGVTDTWMAVNQLTEVSTNHYTTVCVGKEWHRFTSSFFLPTPNFRIGFLKSEFSGQLPKYYPKPTKPGQLSTQISSPDFNDINKEETSRYIDSRKCDYIVDLEDNTASNLQPAYASNPNWEVEAEFEFLNSESSNPFLRAFYLPWISRRYSRYHRYLLLRKNL